MGNLENENRSSREYKVKLESENYIHVQTLFPLSVFIEYPKLIDEYGITKAKELFCGIVHSLVDEEIDYEIILNIDNDELIKLGKVLVKNNEDYNKFFIKQVDENDFFLRFIIAYDEYYNYNVKEFTEMFAPIITSISQIGTAFINNFSREIVKSLAPLYKMMDDLVNNLPKFQINFSKILQGIKEIGEIGNKYTAIMLEFGWPLPKDMPMEIMMNIVKEYECVNKESLAIRINEILVDYYNTRILQELLDTWKKKQWLAKRIGILDAAVTAHCKGIYALSIPVLLSQIEGVIAEGFNHKGFMGGTKLESLVSMLPQNGKRSAIDEAVQRIIREVVWQSFKHGDLISGSINRNAIMHGADVNYGTLENSLKAILLFHYFQEAITIN